jgi:CheY-like chemotaxis protein
MPRVLIVEDEPALRESLRAGLEMAGYEVHEASDGAEGLEKAEHLRPDVIFLDVRMPGLDGYAVCAGLKANPATQRIPVIFLTAVEDVALHRRVREAGGTACLTKPVHLTVLTALAKMVINNARREAAA